MVYFIQKNGAGEAVGSGMAPTEKMIPAGCEKCTKEAYEACLTAANDRVLAAKTEVPPTQAERLRADVDFLAALQGVSL